MLSGGTKHLPRLLAEWVELLQPQKNDWIALLYRLDNSKSFEYSKVVEHMLDEESFQDANMRDCLDIIYLYYKYNNSGYESILNKMKDKGMLPDIMFFALKAHMHSKAGNLDRAMEALDHAKDEFESLRSQVVQSDDKNGLSFFNTATVLKNPGNHEAIRNMFNTQQRGKLSKVYIEWRSKQVYNMVQTAATEISPLLVIRKRKQPYSKSYMRKMASEVTNEILEDMNKAFFEDDEQNMKFFHSPSSGAQGDLLRFREDIQQEEEENEYECMSQEAFESKEEMHKNENFWNFYEFEALMNFGQYIDLPSYLWSDFKFEWLRTKSEMSDFDKKSQRIVQQVKTSEYETRSEAADSQTMFDSKEEVGHTVSSDVVSLDPRTKPVLLGKHKSLTTEGTGSLREEDKPSPSLAKWMEPLWLCTIDWIPLLDGLKQHSTRLYFKVAELVLGGESFEKTKMGDHSVLVEAHLKQDAQGILKKMNRGGISPVTTILNRYIMGGKPEHAKDALECLISQGFQLDTKVTNSMIMACTNAREPKLGESLMTEAESSGVKLTEEMHIALLRSYSQLGDVDGAIRIATEMISSGFLPSMESCNLLVRAFSRAGEPHQARRHFDHITKLGLVPDAKCIANTLVAYERFQLCDVAEEIELFGLHRTECRANNRFTTVLSDCLASSVQLSDKTRHLGRKIEQILVKIDEKRQQRNQMATSRSSIL